MDEKGINKKKRVKETEKVIYREKEKLKERKIKEMLILSKEQGNTD